MTGKQRMLNAYRGRFSDRVAIAPEFWYYYPARLLRLDMIEFERVPFHLALKKTFETFGCEGWGAAFFSPPARDVESLSRQTWISDDELETERTVRTPHGTLTSRSRVSRSEPAWTVERPIKNLGPDLKAWQHAALGDVEATDLAPAIRAWNEVGETYLLEAWLGMPFFDFYATSRQGGLEAAVVEFLDHPEIFEPLQSRYIDHITRLARRVCRETPFESLVIGCSWSCNSLIGPHMWRQWDKPVLRAVADEAHRWGKLLHVHLHGKCVETVGDLAEIGIDCVCPFERPPGGDVCGLDGLKAVAAALDGRVAMNGNVHTVQTLIRGTEADVRREVREIMEAFGGNARLIVGTGDQVGRETPEANLHAMIDEARRLSPAWMGRP